MSHQMTWAAMMPMVARIADQPFGNSSAVPITIVQELAREDGIERMASWDGGDEHSAAMPDTPNNMFSTSTTIFQSIRKVLIEPIVFGPPGGNHIGLTEKRAAISNRANVGMPARSRGNPERAAAAGTLLGP